MRPRVKSKPIVAAISLHISACFAGSHSGPKRKGNAISFMEASCLALVATRLMSGASSLLTYPPISLSGQIAPHNSIIFQVRISVRCLFLGWANPIKDLSEACLTHAGVELIYRSVVERQVGVCPPVNCIMGCECSECGWCTGLF